MSFIDATYFVGELNIPNSGDTAMAERIAWFIQKYEPDLLLKLLGYPLYKAFVAGLAVTPPAVPDIRFINILYGCEYTDLNGDLRKWKGLIVTNSPTYNLAGGLVYKPPIYVRVNATPGFVANSNSAVLDGTSGKDDWRGWTPIITRDGDEVLQPGLDYSWDSTTGTLQLLLSGDVFMPNQLLFTQFQLRSGATPATGITGNESIIAHYVYYWYFRSLTTQTAAIGEVRSQAENSLVVSPRQKLISALNTVHDWAGEFLEFMKTNETNNPTLYPEWTFRNRQEAARSFAFVNPIF